MQMMIIILRMMAITIENHDQNHHVQVHEEVKRECANGSLTAANIQEAAPRLLVEKPQKGARPKRTGFQNLYLPSHFLFAKLWKFWGDPLFPKVKTGSFFVKNKNARMHLKCRINTKKIE